MKWTPTLLVIALLSLCSCGDLDTRYGVHDGDSINGVRCLRAVFSERCQVEDRWLLSDRLHDHDLIVHVATRSELPDAGACTWISEWLESAEEPRQMVIILRDGNVTPFLCQRWANEAQAGGRPELAEVLAKRAQEESLDLAPTTDSCALFKRTGRPSAAVQRLSGAYTGPAPATLRLGAYPELTPATSEHSSETGAEVLIAADGLPLVTSWLIGDYGRLVVIANATALVDGAQADPVARRLLARVIDTVVGYHEDHRPQLAFVGSLRAREAESQELSLLSLLVRAPFAWPLWHLLALLALVVAWRAAWIGRRSRRTDRTAVRFIRHIDALARHLHEHPARNKP